jgi:hypothetical protein
MLRFPVEEVLMPSDSAARLLAAATALVLGLGLGAGSAHADWRVARHDPARSGTSDGHGHLRNPAPYWRYYLGGSVGPALADTIVAAGRPAQAFVAGGRVSVARADGTPVWSSPNLALTALVGSADLDGDGELELVTQSIDQVFVFSARAGALRWAEPAGEMGTINGVRLGDVDDDGHPEIFIQECMCCEVRSGETGVAYSFAAGFGAPRRVWRLPYAYCSGYRAMLVDDFTGDGLPDVSLANFDDIKLLDGATAQVRAASPDLGQWAAIAHCEPADLVAGGGKELVCAFSSALALPGQGHRIFALGYRSNPARLDVLWSTDLGDVDTEFVLGAGWIADLDGDGRLEVSASGTRTDGKLVTAILDAATGETLATIPEQAHLGSLVVSPTLRLYLTSADQALVAWRFDRAATPRLVEAWRLRDRRAVLRRGPRVAGVHDQNQRLMAADVDGDGANELFTVDVKQPNRMPVYTVGAGGASELRDWTGARATTIQGAWIGDDARILISTTDGRLTTLAPDLLTVIGSVRAGGYYDAGGGKHLASAPVAGQLTGTAAAEVVVPDSRRVVVAFSPQGATNAAPPTLLWDLDNASAPALVDGIGVAGPGVVVRRTDTMVVPAMQTLAALDLTGHPRWTTTVGPLAFNDALPGNFDGDAIPDLVLQWGLGSDNALRTTAFAGSDGHPLWTHVADNGIVRFPSGAAVTDWNGDGTDDVVFHHYATYVLDGASGEPLVRGALTPNWYFMPTLVDVTGDGAPEIALHGGQQPLRVLDRELQERWVSPDDDRPQPYAAAVRCGALPVLASTSRQYPARLKVTELAGAAAGQASIVVLAGGKVYASEEAAVAAGERLGQLTSVHVHADLTGLGHPTAVLGSTDGWLYGIDVCARTRDFAVAFPAPVGAVAMADLDGDGDDEVAVSVADGFLYGLANAPIGGPGQVRDVDPAGATTVDIDEVTTRDTLAAVWEAVPGATTYEVAVARAEGGYVSAPAWREVAGTSATLTGLALVDGQRYVVAVRAKVAAGASPDILSDGVLVHLLPPLPAVDAGPDAGSIVSPPTAIGCCSTGSSGRVPGVLALLVLVGLGRRRRAGFQPGRTGA